MDKRFGRTTAEQLQFYVNFCKKYPEIQQYHTDPNYKNAPPHIPKLWAQLAKDLNALRGPTRTMNKWRKSFQHWKKQVRCRTRKLRAQGHFNTADSAYEDLVFYEEKPNIIPKEKGSPLVTKGKSKENDISVEAPDTNEYQSDTELQFDSIYVPCEDMDYGDSNASLSESSTSVRYNEVKKKNNIYPKKMQNKKEENDQNENMAGICHKLVKSLAARETRDERLFVQQQNVIAKLDQTLLLMTQVLIKLNDKLDKL